MSSADSRMARERQLAFDGEDAYVIVRIRVGRLDEERGLGQVGPAGDGLHLGAVEVVGLEHDCKRIAFERHRSENINLLEADSASGHLAWRLIY